MRTERPEPSPAADIVDLDETMRVARGEATRWETLLTRLAK